ncbi:MAG TPA: SpoVR family protein [Stellaceae bacterium]|nr:SpoVR family protein [Stellaceae bacterium]
MSTAAVLEHKPLFEGPEWDFEKIRRVHDAIQEIAIGELGLDIYPNQIEVITSEQMLDAYASVGLPLMYRHWSFGKRFAREEALYRHGLQGLAYEIVINSSPCISYIMEENSMAMQTLVIAHAAFGHNHFFKNNYLFRQWTDADGILDYLTFARDFIHRSEERHGLAEVERVLDAAHALMNHGVHRYARRPKANLAKERRRVKERREYDERTYDDLWEHVVPRREAKSAEDAELDKDRREARRKLGIPEENLLYFLEKHAPRLKSWERELLRIVRNVSQYFYPQKQTRLMNEGCATFVHYEIMNRLHERGLINDGAFLEAMHSHTNVIFQPEYDDRRYNGINPYALGFAMMQDVKRICTTPSDEDREWFPAIAGNGDPWGTLRDAWANYRDESFVLQFLSPCLMRQFRLFKVLDDASEDALVVDAIHDERGYRDIRSALARHYDLARQEPDIQVVDVDLSGDRRLILRHAVHDGVLLDEASCRGVLEHLSTLWHYGIVMEEADASTDRVLKTHEVPAHMH